MNQKLLIKVQIDGLDKLILESFEKERQRLAIPNPNVSEEDKAFDMAGVFNDVVNMFDKQGLYEKVIFYGDMCLAELSKMQCDDHAPYASTVYLLGKAYAQTPNGQETARTHFSRALELAKKQDDYLTGVRAADALGNRELVWTLFEDGLLYYQRDKDPEWQARLCKIMEKILQRQMDEVKYIKFQAERK